MEQRIEAAWDEAISQRSAMMAAETVMQNSEETAISDLGEEWANAKNNDIRKALVRDALAGDEGYQEARVGYRAARNVYRLKMMEVSKLRDLVAEKAARKTGF